MLTLHSKKKINMAIARLIRILDALRLIKDIPATSPDDCVMNICKAINALSMEQKRELTELSLAYTPYVRALLGTLTIILEFPICDIEISAATAPLAL